MSTNSAEHEPIRDSDHRLLLISGAAICLGSLLPWARETTPFGEATVHGTDGSGIYTLMAGAVILALGLMRRLRRGRRVAIALVASVAVTAIALYDLVDVISSDGDAMYTVSVGVGLYVCLAGGAVGMVGSWRGRHRAPTAPAPEADSASIVGAA